MSEEIKMKKIDASTSPLWDRKTSEVGSWIEEVGVTGPNNDRLAKDLTTWGLPFTWHEEDRLPIHVRLGGDAGRQSKSRRKFVQK